MENACVGVTLNYEIWKNGRCFVAITPEQISLFFSSDGILFQKWTSYDKYTVVFGQNHRFQENQNHRFQVCPRKQNIIQNEKIFHRFLLFLFHF